MAYVDTSVLVSLLIAEDHTERAIAWLVRQPLGSLVLSEWVTTEFNSALARKVRNGRRTVAEQTSSIQSYHALVRRSFRTCDIRKEHFDAASTITAVPAAGLRAGDALHLAIAASEGQTLVTLDKRFTAGATGLGYAVELIA